MTAQKPMILVVDDEEICLAQISIYLKELDYKIVTASNGQDALDLLNSDPHAYGLVILDKFMEGMNGIEVLKQIKDDPDLRILPVIMQTADTAPEKILEGIRAGAYYYLTKPFSAEKLLSVVDNALSLYRDTRLAREELINLKESLHRVNELSFSFRNRQEAREMTAFLSCAGNLNMAQEMGLMELLLNAIEHGNLAITYDEKTQLIRDNQLETEINRRLNLPEYADKTVTVKFKRNSSNLTFIISDQGSGFDWEPYLDMQLERINDNHGRGIAMAKNMSFNELLYQGDGNVVHAIIVTHQ
ncbi:response regulator [Methylicorpusculum sp.]|uniref:ATP-binding response regulator n=1 Tax=Methylicorpusculum sp. TaxID=2713644 RepID=UPI00272139F5|nr:response regulator [Methylicorpusculum sp.]MDO8842918.1 response regulator [Methylicorpusculum sp.]